MTSPMFRSDKPTNYERVYEGLVQRLARADFEHARQYLGGREAGPEVALEVLGRTCLVGPDGVRAADGGPLEVTVRIVVAHYLLQAGQGELTGEWLSYRDFKDGAFFHAAFTGLVEQQIAKDFSGRLSELSAAGARLGAEPLEADLGGDLCLRFLALPRVPLGLIFYEADEDFPSSARVLFDASAPLFLDLECLAVAGLILADQLRQYLRG